MAHGVAQAFLNDAIDRAVDHLAGLGLLGVAADERDFVLLLGEQRSDQAGRERVTGTGRIDHLAKLVDALVDREYRFLNWMTRDLSPRNRARVRSATTPASGSEAAR